MGITKVPGRILDAAMDPRLPHGFPLALYRGLKFKTEWARRLKPSKLYVCVTFDVEGNYRNVLDPQSSIDFMPRFIEWSHKVEVRATLYVQGSIVPRIRTLLNEASDVHQLGVHGLNHEVWGRARWWQAGLKIDPLPLNERKRALEEALEKFERCGLGRPTSFRAPYLNIDSYSLKILRECGFRTDSSAASYLGYRPLPRKTHGLWEIPVSANPRPQVGGSLLAPFGFQDFSIGNIYKMSDSQFIDSVDLVAALQCQARSVIPPHLVILGHPWEFIDGAGVSHASTGNFEMLQRKFELISASYTVEFVTLDQLVALAAGRD